jgi:alpha-ketoglutarate-dependent taurine dioxygenase
MDFIMNQYEGVTTRFLQDQERLILSREKEMPLVIEALESTDHVFLSQFLSSHATQIIGDMAKYGAVLLRGFNISSDEQFEKTVLSIPQFRGISDAFMSENGRVPVDKLKYVLHTNSVYKTGGTLYLGGFHTENYYSPDVPGYISFFCKEPSALGGETGIINTAKIYSQLNAELKNKLEKNSYFVTKWLVSEVAERYQIDTPIIEKICKHFDLPIIGEGSERFILMYKPSVFEHPITQEKALQLNLFELPTLNSALRKCFINDYKGRTWFWHRFFWRLPAALFNLIEFLAVAVIAFFHSPKKSFKILRTKYSNYVANKNSYSFNTTKVGPCFSKGEVKDLAQLMRAHYSSCLWKKGDILLIDNKKVMHAGMPGMGERLIRAMVCNPMAMNYTFKEPGWISAQEHYSGTIGEYMTLGKSPQ